VFAEFRRLLNYSPHVLLVDFGIGSGADSDSPDGAASFLIVIANAASVPLRLTNVVAAEKGHFLTAAVTHATSLQVSDKRACDLARQQRVCIAK
jgi:hypothetical protein